MKIGNTPDKAASVAPRNTGTPAAAGEADKAAQGTAADPSAKVALSNTASTLLSGSATAEFDAAKVERISQAIGEGKFKINADVIADKLIANAQELLGKTQR
jgi:negative regulator of flagellin synthesis FlgM